MALLYCIIVLVMFNKAHSNIPQQRLVITFKSRLKEFLLLIGQNL